jgi:hypothetical protein
VSHELPPLLYLVDDPGRPAGADPADPFAGLSEAQAAELRQALEEAVPRWTPDQVKVMDYLADLRDGASTTGSLSGAFGWAPARTRQIVTQLSAKGLVRVGGEEDAARAGGSGLYVELKDRDLWVKWLRWGKEPMAEAKAVGTADLSGDLAVRDAGLRAGWRSTVRYHVRQAATNAPREMKIAEENARGTIAPLLRGWLAGNITYADLEEHSSFLWRLAYEQVHEIGRHASALERLHPDPQVLAEEETWFRSAVREEMRYWQLAIREWRDRRAAATRVRNREERAQTVAAVDERGWQRFEAYVRALRFMFESSRILALPPDVLLYWMGPDKRKDPKDRGICEGCQYMMERSPFVKANIPAVPRDGQTPCLTNCRHKVVIRIGRVDEAARRFQELPARESMVRQLKRIKDESHGAHRQRRAAGHARRTAGAGREHVHNPFHREGLGTLGQEPAP